MIYRHLGFDNFQMLLDYDVRTDDQVVYQGYASPGTSQDLEAWTIYKYTYDASDRATARQIAQKASWTNRATATYV